MNRSKRIAASICFSVILASYHEYSYVTDEGFSKLLAPIQVINVCIILLGSSLYGVGFYWIMGFFCKPRGSSRAGSTQKQLKTITPEEAASLTT